MLEKFFGRGFRIHLEDYEKKVGKKLTNFKIFYFWHFFHIKIAIFTHFVKMVGQHFEFVDP